MLSYNSNELNFNGHSVEVFPLPARIWKVILLSNKLAIVQMAMADMDESKFETCRNIFAVNDQGKVLWQIERAEHSNFKLEGDESVPLPNPFVDIDITKDGILRGWLGHGFRYDIDPKTGKLSNAKFVK